MTDLLARFWVHPVVVERRTGVDGYGQTRYAGPVTVSGFVSDDQRLVVDASGQQVMSSARVALPPTEANVPLGSLITLPAQFGSRRAEVIATARADGGGLPTPDHLEVSLR